MSVGPLHTLQVVFGPAGSSMVFLFRTKERAVQAHHVLWNGGLRVDDDYGQSWTFDSRPHAAGIGNPDSAAEVMLIQHRAQEIAQQRANDRQTIVASPGGLVFPRM